MEIDTSGEDVGARQAAEGELRAVGSATDGLHLRCDTTFLHSLEHDIDDIHVGVDLLLHVVILVFHLDGHSAFAILLVHLLRNALQEVLALLKVLAVVVAYDIAELGLLTVAVDAYQVEEALIALGRRLAWAPTISTWRSLVASGPTPWMVATLATWSMSALMLAPLASSAVS